MSNINVLALVIILVLAIAVVEFFYLYKKVSQKNKRYDALLSESRAQTGKLMNEKKSLERKERILEELIIFSHIGFSPNNTEKQGMIENLDIDIKAVKAGISERKGYKTDRAVYVSHQFNEIGEELIEIYSSLQFSLSQSIETSSHKKSHAVRSLYQELLDYIYYYGFDFCGKHQDRKHKIR